MHRFSISDKCVPRALTISVRAFRNIFFFQSVRIALIAIWDWLLFLSFAERMNSFTHFSSKVNNIFGSTILNRCYVWWLITHILYESISESTLQNWNKNSLDIIFNICLCVLVPFNAFQKAHRKQYFFYQIKFALWNIFAERTTTINSIKMIFLFELMSTYSHRCFPFKRSLHICRPT